MTSDARRLYTAMGVCPSRPRLLGKLGRLYYYRCRVCGEVFRRNGRTSTKWNEPLRRRYAAHCPDAATLRDALERRRDYAAGP